MQIPLTPSWITSKINYSQFKNMLKLNHDTNIILNLKSHDYSIVTSLFLSVPIYFQLKATHGSTPTNQPCVETIISHWKLLKKLPCIADLHPKNGGFLYIYKHLPESKNHMVSQLYVWLVDGSGIVSVDHLLNGMHIQVTLKRDTPFSSIGFLSKMFPEKPIQ